MTNEEKETQLKALKAEFYDVLLSKDTLEKRLVWINQEIQKLNTSPVIELAPRNGAISA